MALLVKDLYIYSVFLDAHLFGELVNFTALISNEKFPKNSFDPGALAETVSV